MPSSATPAATQRQPAPRRVGVAATQVAQTARRLVRRITSSTQSAQQRAPQSAHNPAAGAWQYTQYSCSGWKGCSCTAVIVDAPPRQRKGAGCSRRAAGATFAPMAKKTPPPDVTPALQTFGALLRQGGVAVGAVPPAAPAPAPAAASADGLDLAGAGALVVRRERKGHGGKTVTIIDGLALPPARLEALARAMRKALGCGSWAESGRVALQGDLADQAAAWLQRHGARRITRGN